MANSKSSQSPLTAAVLRKTEWTITKPARVGVILGILGLLMRYSWINTLPLVSGDQGWPTVSRLKTYFPWPRIWDATDGLGGINATFNSFRYPIYAIEGWMAHFGAHWWLIERVVQYLPDAVVVPIAGWYLAREIVGESRWSLLGAVLFASSTYLLIESNSEVPLALGAAIGCFALVSFVRSLKHLSIKWAVVTALWMALASAVDIRPAFITALMMGLYFVVSSITEPTPRLIAKRLGISTLAGALYLTTQLFWLLPLLAYGTNSQLPIAKQPDFNIATLPHSLSGVIAWWTGANPAPYVQGLLNPTFLILPLAAFIVLTRRKISPEVLWLALCAIVFAFLGKTNTAPFGSIYNWIFAHVPGFNLFREGSKFLYPVVAAYSALIPLSLKSLSEVIKTAGRNAKILIRLTQVALLATLLSLSGACLWSLFNGSLLATTIPTVEPKSFVQLTQQLNRDRSPGQLLWFGGPVFRTANGVLHSYNIASPVHPFDQLNGNTQSLIPAADDPFQNFCPVHSQPYCYVNSTLLPYLLGQTNTTYIVIPKGVDVGALPGTATSSWLKQQIASIYGQPRTLGSGSTAIYVWHLTSQIKVSVVRGYGSVGLVNSGPWALRSIVPALTWLHVPAAYEQTYSQATLPSTPTALPDSIKISPYMNGGFKLQSQESVVVLVKSKSPQLAIKVRGESRNIHLLLHPHHLYPWGVYGPITLPSGFSSISLANISNANLGPSVQWAAQTRAQITNKPFRSNTVKLSTAREKISAVSPGVNHPWISLNIDYDKGWLLHGHRPTVLGGGLLNLYYQPSKTNKPLTFQFFTYSWEILGLAISSAITLLSMLFLIVVRRRTRTSSRGATTPSTEDRTSLASSLGAYIGAIAAIFLVITVLAQTYMYYGIPSRFPSLSISADPYLLNTDFATMAIVLLSLSILIRLGAPLIGTFVHATNIAIKRSKRTSVALIATSALTLSSCGTVNYQAATSSLTIAEIAGGPSNTILGSNLEAARQAFVAKNPVACIQGYTEAVTSFPDQASIYSGRSQCYASQGVRLMDASLNDAIRASQLSPTNPNILFQLAQSFQSVGKINASESTYIRLANLADSSPQLIKDAIDGLIQLHKFAEARLALNIELTKFPTSPISYLAKSDLQIAEQDEYQALRSISLAARYALGTPASYADVNAFSCGIELQILNYKVAKTQCKIALDNGLSSSAVWENLAVIEANQGNYAMAIRYMNSAIGSFVANVGPYAQPTGVIGFGLANLLATQGEFYVEEGQPANGIRDFETALRDLPPNAPDMQAELEADIQSAST